MCPQKWLHNNRNHSWTEICQSFCRCKLFFKEFAKKKRREKKITPTNRKVAALLKLLCLSKQSRDLAAFWGRSMKAAHRQPQPWACYLCLLFIVSPTWIKDIKWNSSEKRRKTGWCLTEGGNRQLAESFGSGGCQGAGEMAELGSGLKRGGDAPRLMRLSSS